MHNISFAFTNMEILCVRKAWDIDAGSFDGQFIQFTTVHNIPIPPWRLMEVFNYLKYLKYLDI